jgi:integrase
LKPKQKWKSGDTIWFERRVIGKNTLDQRVKEMGKETGVEGNFSNHSLRATAVTRMFKAGLPEKQIMKRSGH